MSGVNYCGQCSQCAKVFEQLNGCTTMDCQALLNFCFLLVSMHMQWQFIGMTICSYSTNPLPRYSTHRVRSNSDRSAFKTQSLNTVKIRIDGGIAETPLFFLRWLIETALSVGCHKQYNTYTHLLPCLYDSFRHYVGIGIRLPVQ